MPIYRFFQESNYETLKFGITNAYSTMNSDALK